MQFFKIGGSGLGPENWTGGKKTVQGSGDRCSVQGTGNCLLILCGRVRGQAIDSGGQAID
jgi:hypothetical protein